MRVKITTEQLKDAVNASTTMAETLSRLNLSHSGSSYGIMRRRLEAEGISTSHWTGYKPDPEKIRKGLTPLTEKLKKYPEKRHLHVKARILREGLLSWKCSECGNLGVWNGKPLILQLDHIDGDLSNWEINNLRIICPNCHTQTETFGTRKFKGTGRVWLCSICGEKVPRGRITCSKHREYYQQTHSSKAEHSPYTASVAGSSPAGSTNLRGISEEEMRVRVNQEPVSSIAQSIGISGNAVAKWCKRRSIPVPGRGYWAKVKVGKIP